MPRRLSFLLPLAYTLSALFSLGACAQETATLRAPATPLVTHDPYFSIWSLTDHLTDRGGTRHWTGKPQPLNGLVRIDNQTFRFLGGNDRELDALKETRRSITPTHTIVTLEGGGIELTLTFMEAALPQDLERMARPVTYLTWTAKSSDGRPHQVTLYLDADGTLAANDRTEPVQASRGRAKGLDLLRIGTQRQAILDRFGDDLRIDWGYFYFAVPTSQAGARLAAGNTTYRDDFVHTGTIPEEDALDQALPAANRYPAAPLLSVVLPLGEVSTTEVSRHILLAYDDIYSVEYMHQRLLPYWRKGASSFQEMLSQADSEYAQMEERTRKLDETLTADLTKVGGADFSTIATLAYRQAIAAHKLVENGSGAAYFMPKENSSNGSISTVDVIYPSAPMFLLMNPKLVEAQLLPVLEYAEMPRWKFPFAPHDVGVYPLANGQQYGGGELTEENQMPVEESGDILLLAAAIAHAENNTAFAQRFWPLLTKWAEFLSSKGLDPENQLSTDDFAGHLAHNSNLSIKAIEALGAYAQLARQLGHGEEARKYSALSESMARKWIGMAEDGDHYKLAFDKPGTWSQKYNLAWDTILGLNLFPASVREKEVAFYKQHMNTYGLPLDNRATYTKMDWEIWTATLAGNRADFEGFIRPIYKFLNETPDRVPMSDWYDTISGKMSGFQARSVVGGVYIPMLADPAAWKRWASGAEQAR